MPDLVRTIDLQVGVPNALNVRDQFTSQMDTGIKRTQRDYTLAFKLAVVEQVEQGEMTYIEAQRRYGIQGRSTVLKWIRKHGVGPRHKALAGIIWGDRSCHAQYR